MRDRQTAQRRRIDFSRRHLDAVGLTFCDLGLATNPPAGSLVQFQQWLAAEGCYAAAIDGLIGDKSIAGWLHHRRRTMPVEDRAAKIVLNGRAIDPPAGVTVLGMYDAAGFRFTTDELDRRDGPTTQLILHRGVQSRTADAGATFRALQKRRYSSTFTIALDGTLLQHADPAVHSCRHAIHHNGQSDGIDLAGPLFTVKKGKDRKGAPGQVPVSMMLHIGRKGDPPSKRRTRVSQVAAILKRKGVGVRYYSPTPEQTATLLAFVPWWCQLRGIPARAVSDYRCLRIGGDGRRDPVTDATGIYAHCQVAGPGSRVDGAIALHMLRDAEGIEWITADQFFADEGE